MDNKWIIQQTHRLIVQMKNYGEECMSYPDAWRGVDWDKYYELQDQLEDMIKIIENGE